MKTLLRMGAAGIVPAAYLLAWPGARDPYHTVMAFGAYAIVGLVVLLWHQRQAASEQALTKRASARTRQLMKQASGDSFVVSLLKGVVQGAVVFVFAVGLVFAVGRTPVYGLFYNLDQTEFVKTVQAIAKPQKTDSYLVAVTEIENRISTKEVLTDEDRTLATMGMEYLLSAAELSEGNDKRAILDKAIAWAQKYGLDGRLAQERRKAAEPTPTPLPAEPFTPTNTPTKTPKPTNTPTTTVQPTLNPSPTAQPQEPTPIPGTVDCVKKLLNVYDAPKGAGWIVQIYKCVDSLYFQVDYYIVQGDTPYSRLVVPGQQAVFTPTGHRIVVVLDESGVPTITGR